MKRPVKYTLIAVLFLAVVFDVLSFAVRRIDGEKYRTILAADFRNVYHRDINLNGPIRFSLGAAGLLISAEDVSLASPSGLNRPDLATIGRLVVRVKPKILWGGGLFIKRAVVENADIFLEPLIESAAAEKTQAAPEGPVGAKTILEQAIQLYATFPLEKVDIVNSQIAMLDVQGLHRGLNIASLKFRKNWNITNFVLNGDVKGEPLAVDLRVNVRRLEKEGKSPIHFMGSFGGMQVQGQGVLDRASRELNLSSWGLHAGNTDLSGSVVLSWGGARPMVRGTLGSPWLNLSDFISGGALTTDDVPEEASFTSDDSGRLFGDNPIPDELLKSFDADFAVDIGEFPIGLGGFRQIHADLILSEGRLILSPVSGFLGVSPVDLNVGLIVTQPLSRIDLALNAENVALEELQKLVGLTPFLTGQATASLQLTGEGNSPHEMASSLGGIVSISAENGQILPGVLSHISSLLASIFPTEGDDNALNCLALRFIARNGILVDNGILIDSAASTIGGRAEINLNAETLRMFLRARPKVLNIEKLIPPLLIEGPLRSPEYIFDTANVVPDIVGSIAGKGAEGEVVPMVRSGDAGQNACLYTLNHPIKSFETDVLSPQSRLNLFEKALNIGRSLLNMLLGL